MKLGALLRNVQQFARVCMNTESFDKYASKAWESFPRADALQAIVHLPHPISNRSGHLPPAAVRAWIAWLLRAGTLVQGMQREGRTGEDDPHFPPTS